jgi:hypothetical protein
VYCLGRDGKLMPGWPYSGKSLHTPAVGPDGTLYVAQTTSSDTNGVTSFPYQVLAIGQDGKPKPGWTPWARADNQTLTTILPTGDGRVYMLIGGDFGKAQLVTVDSTGRTLDDHPELGPGQTSPNYKDAVLTSDGSLFVSVDGGSADFVNAYSPNGSQITGWPQLIGGWGDIAVGSQGSVWVAWTVYGPTTTTTDIRSGPVRQERQSAAGLPDRDRLPELVPQLRPSGRLRRDRLCNRANCRRLRDRGVRAVGHGER